MYTNTDFKNSKLTRFSLYKYINRKHKKGRTVSWISYQAEDKLDCCVKKLQHSLKLFKLILHKNFTVFLLHNTFVLCIKYLKDNKYAIIKNFTL